MVDGAADEEQPLILAIGKWDHQVQFVQPERDRMLGVARVEIRLVHQHHAVTLAPAKYCTIMHVWKSIIYRRAIDQPTVDVVAETEISDSE